MEASSPSLRNEANDITRHMWRCVTLLRSPLDRSRTAAPRRSQPSFQTQAHCQSRRLASTHNLVKVTNLPN